LGYSDYAGKFYGGAEYRNCGQFTLNTVDDSSVLEKQRTGSHKTEAASRFTWYNNSGRFFRKNQKFLKNVLQAADKFVEYKTDGKIRRQ